MLPAFGAIGPVLRAAGCAGHPTIVPSSIHELAVVDAHAEEFMYLDCVRFIRSVKTGASFAEHSPLLNDISAVPKWSKALLVSECTTPPRPPATRALSVACVACVAGR